MKSLGIIFPDQLSLTNPVLDQMEKDDTLLFYEPLDTFYDIPHHKHKLVFLISSFRHFIKKISHEKILHKKIEKNYSMKMENYLKELYAEIPFSTLFVSKPSDFKCLRDLMFFCQSHQIDLKVLEDKKFITTSKDFDIWKEGKKSIIQEFYYSRSPRRCRSRYRKWSSLPFAFQTVL